MAGAGPQRKTSLYAGKFYSAVGTAANQTVKTSGALVRTIVVAGSGSATVYDGAVQMCVITAPAVVGWNCETQTSLVVNAPATATVSISYD